MDAKEVVKKLSQHPVVKSDMAMQVQLGLPYLERRNGKLCISFKPHVEKVNGENIEFYKPQYEIAWVYPFNHLIFFSNFSYSRDIDLAVPAVKLPLIEYGKHGIYLVEELFEKCTWVLNFQEDNGAVTDVCLKKYRQTYYEVVNELGLESIYGEGYL